MAELIQYYREMSNYARFLHERYAYDCIRMALSKRTPDVVVDELKHALTSPIPGCDEKETREVRTIFRAAAKLIHKITNLDASKIR